MRGAEGTAGEISRRSAQWHARGYEEDVELIDGLMYDSRQETNLISKEK